MTEQLHEDEAGQTTEAPVEEICVAQPRTTCPQCGAENEVYHFYCRGCRKFLPAGPDDQTLLDEADRLFHLVQACEMVASGEATLADFQVFMNEFAAEQRRREGVVRTVEIPFGLEDEFAEERSVGNSGIDTVNSALETLAAYDPASPDSHLMLREGLRGFHEGMARVKEAMRINRNITSKPIWI